MRTTAITVLLWSSCLAGLCGAGLCGADWPQWRGPMRDGISSERIGPAGWRGKSPELVWRTNVGTGFSSIAVSAGRAYTMGNRDVKDVIWCFDARTGRAAWKHEYSSKLGDYLHEGGPGSTPTLDGGRVFTISKWGVVHCLDAERGTVLWRRDLRGQEGVKPNEWGLSGSPLVYRDLVLFNAGGAGVALDRKSGETIWINGTDTTGYASPMLFRPKEKSEPSVLLFVARSLVAVSPTSGKVLWRYPWKTGYDNNNADPVVLGDRIFITTYDRGAACLEASSTGVKPLYERRVMNTHMAPPVRVGEYVYGFSGHHARRPDFRCVHLGTGEIAWRQHDMPAGSVMVTGGKLLILDGKGELVVAEPTPEAFRPLARARVLEGRCWTPPALADGLLYARNSRGELRCVRLRRDEDTD